MFYMGVGSDDTQVATNYETLEQISTKSLLNKSLKKRAVYQLEI